MCRDSLCQAEKSIELIGETIRMLVVQLKSVAVIYLCCRCGSVLFL